MNQQKSVAIIGCGLIGASLAVLFTGNGYQVTLLSHSQASLDKGIASYRRFFTQLVDNHVLTQAQMERCAQLLSCTTDYADLKEEAYVIESVVEKLDVKHDIYRQIEQHCKADTLILSASSAIETDNLCQGALHPQRILLAHPWNPPHLVPCVEVVPGTYTTPEVVERTVALYTSVKREVVVMQKSAPGFIGNRLQHALYREALYMVEQGMATPEEIDRTILSSFGPRYSAIGLFEHQDLAGLDLVKEITTYLYPTLCASQSPVEGVCARAAKGDIGQKSGVGYLDWRTKDMDDFRARQLQPYLRLINWDLPE